MGWEGGEKGRRERENHVRPQKESVNGKQKQGYRGVCLLGYRVLHKLQKHVEEEVEEAEGGQRKGGRRGGGNRPNEMAPTPREIAKGFQPAAPSVTSDSRANLISVSGTPRLSPYPRDLGSPPGKLTEQVCHGSSFSHMLFF